jgi:hypothetical protein
MRRFAGYVPLRHDSPLEERGFEPPVPLANKKVIRDRAEGGSTTRIPSTATATKRVRSGSYGCDTGRVAVRGRACGNIASDHATRADHGIISDGHARQNDRTAADPHILTDPDGASELGARPADRRVARMVCRVDLDRRADLGSPTVMATTSRLTELKLKNTPSPIRIL